MQKGIGSVAIFHQADRARPDKVIWCGISVERNHEPGSNRISAARGRRLRACHNGLPGPQVMSVTSSKRLVTKHARWAQKGGPRAATNSVSAILDFVGTCLLIQSGARMH